MLLKKVNNANPGDADHFGGNDLDRISDYFNDIDTAEIPRINNPTEYRSGILKIRDGSNAFNVTIKSATQTADRDYTIPPLIGNDSPATLASSNIYTALQTVSIDADTLLSLYRPVSTTNALCGLGFYERNSSNASVPYSAIFNRLVVNTAGDEDGKLVFYVRKDGVLTEVGSIDKNGLLTIGSVSTGGGTPAAILADANIFTNINTFSSDNQRVIKLYRPTNTVNNIVGLEFDHKNSAGTQIEYGRIVTQNMANTAGAEDGKMLFSVMKAGVLTQVASIDKNGLLTVNSISTGGAAATITVLLNTGVTVTTASTSAEFDMLNYTVPANTLGTNGVLRVTITGYVNQNQATATDLTFKIKFGGTIIYQSSFVGLPQQAINKPFRLIFDIGNKNATNSQGMSGHLQMNDSTSTAVGEGSLLTDEQTINGMFRSATGGSAADTTANQVLAVTMQHSVSSASVSTSIQRRMIEFIPGA